MEDGGKNASPAGRDDKLCRRTGSELEARRGGGGGNETLGGGGVQREVCATARLIF